MQQKWNQNFDGEPMTDIPQKFLNAGCDVYMVMQLRHDEKILDERFASMRELNRRGKTPDPEHYEVTYYADLPAMWQDVPNNEILEELFQMFNLSRPQDFEGHSLSVSDVIALKRNGKVSVHYVDSIGFKELPGFLDKKPEHSSVLQKLNEWYTQFNVKRGHYYLIVGRFVPENNYETMITEFMRSKTEKDLVIITNVEHNKFYEQLREKTGFEKDKRIKFVGTVYDQDLLKKIREEAYGYLHGHEVGGTNPSLLEALASTRLNLLLGVGFNKEVGEDSALYWSKEPGNLSALLEKADALDAEIIEQLDEKSTARVQDAYSWEKIISEYERVFNV